jgi:hypothetical protein
VGKELKGWNCVPGDIVTFVLHHRTEHVPGKFFWGKVISRPDKKTACIDSGHFEQTSGRRTATVHVSCIRIMKAVPRKPRRKKKVRITPIAQCEREYNEAMAARRKRKAAERAASGNKIKVVRRQKRRPKVKKGGKNVVGGMTFKW